MFHSQIDRMHAIKLSLGEVMYFVMAYSCFKIIIYWLLEVSELRNKHMNLIQIKPGENLEIVLPTVYDSAMHKGLQTIALLSKTDYTG
jgi:hypothetical protein